MDYRAACGCCDGALSPLNPQTEEHHEVPLAAPYSDVPQALCSATSDSHEASAWNFTDPACLCSTADLTQISGFFKQKRDEFKEQRRKTRQTVSPEAPKTDSLGAN